MLLLPIRNAFSRLRFRRFRGLKHATTDPMVMGESDMCIVIGSILKMAKGLLVKRGQGVLSLLSYQYWTVTGGELKVP